LASITSISAIAKFGFWATFLVLTYLFLVPQQYLAPEIFDWWDKLQHSLAFGVLTILALIAYGLNQTKVRRATFALGTYGALIEVLQSLSGWRYGEFRDWLADLLGVVIAWGVFIYLHKHPYTSRFLKAP
jgi:VanZ family protein